MSDRMEPLTQEDGRSKDLVKQNVERLKQIFPEIVTDGKIDFETLKEELGEFREVKDERYSFTWNGKSKARKLAMEPSRGTLRPAPEESVNWDDTEHLFIEGDNLEVLKLLQRSYHKKVKMIYIDPPYNTGNDFVYSDDYRDNLSNYLKLTGQLDGDGKKISSNPEYSGRYHTNWLNMMYPRLKLARELLTKDGVMFISIDDNELERIVMVCNDIFGETNTDIYIWDVREEGTMPKTARNTVRKVHEYIIAVYKNSSDMNLKKYKSRKYKDKTDWTNPDDDPRGPWMSANISRGPSESSGGANSFVITNPAGIEFDRDWAISKEEYQELLEDNRIYFANNGEGVPRKKIFKDDLIESTQSSVFEGLKSSQYGRKEIKEYIPEVDFDYPKPTILIDRLIEIGSNDKSIIMDFFAGSGTTAHSTFNQNLKHGSNRKFIMIQLPEPLDKASDEYKAGYSDISDIAKVRIKESVEGIRISNPDYNGDLGFKVFKLDSSNIKPWDPSFNEVQLSIEDSIENIKPDRSEKDLLYEILLKYGIDLSLPIEERTIDNSKVYIGGAGALVLCPSDNISLDVVEGIAEIKKEYKPEIMRVVFRDSGFKDDVVKTNAIQILKQHEIEDVKSI